MMSAKKASLAKVLKFLGKYRLLVFVAAILAVIIVALTLYVPMLIGNAIDLITTRDGVDIHAIVSLLIKTAILVAITAIAQWLMSNINNIITYNVVRDMRNRAFEKIERLPLAYIDTHPKGDLVSRVISDVDTLADGLLLGFTQLFTGVLTIVGTLGFMLAIDWRIALVVVLLTPLSLIIAKYIGSKTHSMFTLRSMTNGEQTAYIEEMLKNQKVVLAFSHEEEAAKKFENINERLEKASLKSIFFSSLVNPTTRFVNNVVYAAVALTGALSAIFTAGSAEPFTVGMITCLLAYTNQYTKPFNEISGVIAEFQNALASGERIFELIEEPSEISDEGCDELTQNTEGKIDIKNVSFSYDKSGKLIQGLNLSVNPGERIAIVGPTGCGKTTVINLLMRFYDVDFGSVCIDGQNIRHIKRHSLRRNIGMVLQETWLKNGTVKENIAFSNPSATDEQIISAAKAAHAHSFIKRLKNGYDTVIGESNGDLSQGQKQLICIARVMLTLPPMLILDEATSSIDTRTEIMISRAFEQMMKNRTSFIVAHRLSTIKNADTILVMKDGNIIEQGKHAELLKFGGFYRELYDSQFAH